MIDKSLYHGDCLEVMQTFSGEMFDAILTDPPYQIGSGVVRGGCSSVDKLPGWDEFQSDWVAHAARVLKEGGSVVAFTDTRRPGKLWSAYKKAGLHPRQLIYWHKSNPPPNPRRSFMSATEVAVWATKGTHTYWDGKGTTHNVWYGPIVTGTSKHPTQKPTDLMEWLVRLLCPPGGNVLDPFMGSGSTGVACINSGRKFFGIELEDEYYQTATRRLNQARRNRGFGAFDA